MNFSPLIRRVLLAALAPGLAVTFWLATEKRSPEAVLAPAPSTPRAAAPTPAAPPAVVAATPPIGAPPIAVAPDPKQPPSMRLPFPVLPQPFPGTISAELFDWIRDYLKSTPEERPAMVERGRQLAEARRVEFKALISDDPRRALEEAVPMVVRQQLPPEIVNRLEERVNRRADLRVYQGAPEIGAAAPAKTLTHRIAQFTDGSAYVANVYGRRAQDVLGTKNDALNGVAVDNQFAVNEDPVRVLEAGEKPDPAKQVVGTCPVSGKQVIDDTKAADPVAADNTAVETPEQIVYLCGGYHKPTYETLLYAEGGTGGPVVLNGILPAAPTPSIGMLKVLYIPMTFLDQNRIPATESRCYEVMRDVADFYAKGSYGKLTTLSTVTPPVKLPHTETWYTQKDTTNGGTFDGLSLEFTHAKEAAKQLGFDWNDYDCVIVRLSGGPRSTGVGGWGGGSQVWVYSDNVTIVGHEIGHTFGLSHANYWDTTGTSAIGAGTNAEYGDVYDIMGNGGTPTDHYNVQAKNQIKWLPNDFVSTITQSGTYRIHAMDQPILEPANRYAIKIVKDSQRTYWGEVRQLYNGSASRPWADKGMLLGWTFAGGANGSNIQLIDTTPGSPFGKDDAAISLGRTFSDYESGIHITTTNISTTTPKYVDIVVNFGQFPGNNAPTLSLASSADVVPTGATVTFTATASDLDGDTLAYSWQNFGDTAVKIVSPNSNVITRTFSTAGTYIVSCTVSDLKGGSVTRNKLITVGNGNGRSTIAGRVTVGGVGLANVIITANSATNSAVTDSDGYYVLPNLPATTYSMTPLLYGYTFSETFNNNVTVGPNFTGADFVAQATPVVTIAATVPNAQEPGTGTGVVAGHFTLTRTGDITQPLTVSVNSASGTATKTTDYTLSPDYVTGSQGFSTFNIPADSATLDITLTPVTDALAEGPETAILQLGPGSGYLVGNSSAAMVTITDDPADTTLPKVSLAVGNAKTIEGSGSPATLIFSRTGSTGSPLTVNYVVTGTATAGTDYTALPGSVTIPAGSASGVVNVAPLNDSVSEPLETVILTTSANAAYLVETVASTATVSIVDDDLQIVSVTAPDASAKEVDLNAPGALADTATFLISRTGDTSGALTVYYAVSGPTTGSAALNGVDFETLPGLIVIPAGANSATVTITPRYDALGEGREYVTLQLGAGPTSYQLGTSNSATITIDDAATDTPYVEVINLSNAAEPSSSGVFRISVKGSGTGTLTINYTVGGTAVAGTDYTSIGNSTTVTLNNGTATKDISVPPIDNAAANDLRTITLSLSPSATYQTFAPTSTATMWLTDNEQPTVYADAYSTSYPPAITEGGAAGSFYLSRTGSTASALTVNYTMSGTAVNGTDYAALSGTAIIPAGAPGVEVTLTSTNDAVFQGTRTIILTLAAGAYNTGPSATMYLNDNETSTQKVQFLSASGAGSESVTAVNIPVNLTSAATVPVTVDYVVDTGLRSSASSTVGTIPVQPLPYWVRVVRSGNTFTNYSSPDGVTWLQRGLPQTITMSTTSYTAGLVACSGLSGTSSAATLSNFTITGLDGGGSAGAVVGVDVGGLSPAGSHSLSSGTYTLNSGGPDLAINTTDGFRYVYCPITNSANCTITARIVTVTGSLAASKAGVMIRESTASNAVHDSSIALKDSTFRQTYRLTAGAAGLVNTSTTRPWWVRLQRAGNVFSSFTSLDGATWSQLGANQTMALSGEVLAGLAVSARGDGLLSTATFDNVTLTGSPNLQGRTVGFVNAQGSDSLNAGVYTVTGSGTQIGSTEDECHFVAAPVTGDFTITARVLTQSGGAANAQAGVMVRELPGFRARSLYTGLVANAGAEFIYRNTTLTNALGVGIDYTLPSGTLTFNVGDITQNIPLTIVNDTLAEPDEELTILLRNANGAQLTAANTFTYTIIDNDTPPLLPSVGFTTSTPSAAENSGTVNVLVALSEPSPSSVTVDYSVTAGTATAGLDFTAGAGTLTFNPGETIKAIPVALLDDSLVEGSETVVLNITNPSNGVLSTQNTATLTILDDDSPAVTIAATSPNATEAGTPGVFTFTRTGSLSGALIVNFTRSGSATSGTDYTAIATPGTVTIPNGQATTTLNVTPIEDTANEGAETVIITLAAGSYTLGSPSTATVNIADNDRSTINIAANDPNASETAGNPGQFTITRSAPTTSSLAVIVTITGTATNGTDYTTIAGSAIIGVGQSSTTINVTPTDDSLIEGPESVVVQISPTAGYDVGPNNFATVTIADNDNPPTLFISSPSAQGPLIASGNGLIVGCTVTDDGFPQAVTVAWSQASGPGAATFATPTATSSAVTFSTDGVYVLRVTATDGQFTVSDQTTVIVGAAIAPADWITQDMSPSISVRGQTLVNNGVYTLTGTGTGYAASGTDAAQLMVRQISGNGTVVARLSSLIGSGSPLGGVTIRDTLYRGAKRAVLGFVPGSGLQFRTRTTANATDLVTTQAGIALPVWVKLDRDATTNAITASYAPDAAGAPGTWTVIETAATVSMDNDAEYGLTATSNNASTTAVAAFDNLALTPAPSGPALLTEDIGSGNAVAGSYSVNAGTTTINSTGALDGSGYFVAQQYFGDLVVTAKLTSASSGSPNARAGIMIRESMDLGGYAFVGRNPTSSFGGYLWRTFAGGSASSIPTFTGTVRWMRLIRQGNSITAFHAADVSGSPGTWTQIGQPQTVIMATPVMVGLAVDNASLSTLNTATFTNLTVVPLNKAPIVGAGNFAAMVSSPVSLAGTVSDDNYPAPPSLTSLWTAVSGPGSTTFGNASAPSTTATFSIGGAYTLRLRASDGSVETFDDVSLTASVNGFLAWQGSNFSGGSANPDAAANADPDHDGIVNLLEYAFGTSPNTANPSPVLSDVETIGSDRFLRLTVTKNPAATDLLYEVQATNSITPPATWSSTGLVIELNNAATLRVRDNIPLGSSTPPARFLHVLVTKP